MKKLAVLSVLCLLFTVVAPSLQAMTVAEVEQATTQLVRDEADQGKVKSEAAINIFLVLGAGLTEVSKNLEAEKSTELDQKILTSLQTTLPALFNTVKQGAGLPSALTAEGKKLVRLLYQKQNEYNPALYSLPAEGLNFPSGTDLEYAQSSALSYALLLAANIPTKYDGQGKVTEGLSLPVYDFNMLYADLLEKTQQLLDDEQIKAQIQQAFEGFAY